jgi:autotransporter-associated beta strand protein
MKLRSNPFGCLALSIVSATSLQAATLYWDGNDTSANADGGLGAWDTATSNWDDAASAGNPASWPAASTGDDDAVFGGVAATVTIDAAGVTANDLTFSTASYIVAGGVLTLDSLDPDGPDPLPAPAPVVTNGVAATINANLAGSLGLTKSGNGTLTLGGTNSSLSGALTVSGATSGVNGGIVINGSAALGSFSSIDIQNNSFINLANVTIPSSIPVKIAGGGGTGAPEGVIKGSSGANVVAGAITLDNSTVRVGNLGTSLTISGAMTAPVASGYGLLIRKANNAGVIFSNTGNYWEGATSLADGSAYFQAGTLPATTNLVMAGSASTWFETNGSFTRAIGSGAGQVLFNATASRINGFSARGGDLTVNIGGASAPLVWGSVTPPFNPGILGLAGANATGTLTLQNPLDLGGASRTIDVVNGAAEVDARISGAITNGLLNKTGSGVLALASANSFTTATMVFGTASTNRGALRIEDDDALSGITLIDMNSAVNSSARARIELVGGVTVTGTEIRTGGHGDVTGDGAVLANISGNNTWGGVVRISNSGGSYGIRSDAGTLTLAGTLQNGIGSIREWFLGGAGNITISGNVVNGGSSGLNINKHGAGTLTLTGAANSYSLGTVIGEGTVQVGDGGEDGSLGSGPVTNNATLVFDRAGTLSVPGAISGTGTITKRGDGTVTLAGATISHAGTTSIEDGGLIIAGDATLATAAVSVGDGIGAADSAVLGGSGPLGGSVTVGTDGAIAPGASAGTLGVLGSATINGSLLIELDGPAGDRLNVAGNLDIDNAALKITTLAGGATEAEYVVATFDTLSGAEFASVSGVPANYELQYDLTNKRIVLVSTATPGFDAWIDAYAVADPAAGADPDFDGLANAIEYVIGGDPSVASRAGAPEGEVVGDDLVFTFFRVDSSETPDLALTVQAGTTLALWPEAFTIGVNNAGSSAGVNIIENDAAPDEITVTIPKAGALKKFARLNATVTP